ncbi:hypothetical protein IF2G_04584 [Cordyceps javanica]|nr:hypothetical protein IF2G_04584 [Cordyceps javanica]
MHNQVPNATHSAKLRGFQEGIDDPAEFGGRTLSVVLAAMCLLEGFDMSTSCLSKHRLSAATHTSLSRSFSSNSNWTRFCAPVTRPRRHMNQAAH